MRRTRLVPALVSLLTLLVGLAAFSAFAPSRAAATFALQGSCAENTNPESLVIVTEPPGPNNFQATGPAPLNVVIAFVPGVIAYPAGTLSLTILWGDGASTPVQAVRCGEDEVAVPAQSISHTYGAPGQYLISLDIDFPMFPITPIVAFVVVSQATPPTIAPTIPPTSTPAQPTPAPGTATATPGQSTPGPSPTRTPETLTPVGLPVGSPTATPADGTPTRQPSPSPTQQRATATPAPTEAGPGQQSPTAEPPRQNPTVPPGQPDIIYSVEAPQEISTDPAVLGTNLVIAGCTVWVLFTSVLLNQVLDERRGYLDAKLSSLKQVLRRGKASLGAVEAPTGRLRQLGELASVLLFTGLIYSFLQPGTGLNRATAIMLTAALVGSAGVALLVSGIKALVTSRWTGVPTAIRAYPLALAVAVASVVVSRVLGLSPGVMYGFVASCVVLGHVNLDRATEGRIAFVPVLAGLSMAALAWVGFGFLHALEADSFVALAAEATLIVIFIEGIEGITFSLVPVSLTDGGKLFNWNRLSWAALALVSSFAAWHVLIGRDQQYFSGLRQAQSMTVLLVFAAYSILTAGLWFWLRKAGGEPPDNLDPTEAAPPPDPAQAG